MNLIFKKKKKKKTYCTSVVEMRVQYVFFFFFFEDKIHFVYKNPFVLLIVVNFHLTSILNSKLSWVMDPFWATQL